MNKKYFSTLLKNTIIVMGTGLIVKLIGLFGKIMTTRILGIEGMSLYVLSYPTLLLFINISGFSLNTTISKLTSEAIATKKYSPKKILYNGIKLSLLISLICGVIYLLTIRTISNSFLKNDNLFFPLLSGIFLIFLVGISDGLRGYYNGIKITVCSTGIGAPSTEIAVIQLIALGAKALIRIGGTGVLKEEVPCGAMVLNTGAVRRGGSSCFYAPSEYPALASFEVLDCLKRACEEREQPYSMGVCMSVGSFYHGQGRQMPFETGYDENAVLEQYKKWNILNMEMEAETIFTLASLNNVFSGSICAVHCNRITDQWLVDFEPAQKEMCRTALAAGEKLYKEYLHRK